MKIDLTNPKILQPLVKELEKKLKISKKEIIIKISQKGCFLEVETAKM